MDGYSGINPLLSGCKQRSARSAGLKINLFARRRLHALTHLIVLKQAFKADSFSLAYVVKAFTFLNNMKLILSCLSLSLQEYELVFFQYLPVLQVIKIKDPTEWNFILCRDCE